MNSPNRLQELVEEYRSQVRDTQLVRAPFFDGVYGERVWIKDESDLAKHPTGTFKDRRNAELIARIIECGKFPNQEVLLTTITSGNSGASLEYWVQRANEDIAARNLGTSAPRFVAVSIVDISSSLNLGKNLGCYVLPLNLSAHCYELKDIVREARSFVQPRGHSPAKVLHVELTTFNVREHRLAGYFGYNPAYTQIVEEIELPSFTIVSPVGNGELLRALENANSVLGSYNVIGGTVSENPFGRKILYRANASLPQLGICNTLEELLNGYKTLLQDLQVDPIQAQREVEQFTTRVQSWNLGFHLLSHELKCGMSYDPKVYNSPLQFHPVVGVSMADKLACPESVYAHHFQFSGNPEAVVLVGEKDIEQEYALWQQQGLRCEPSAAVAGVTARILNQFNQNNAQKINQMMERLGSESRAVVPYEDVVILNTGRGIDYKE